MSPFQAFIFGVGATASFITMCVVIYTSFIVCSYINYKRKRGQ